MPEKHQFFLLILDFKFAMKSVCEEQHFKQIYKEQSKPLRNFIYYKCGDLDKAEDLVQEAMVSLWENCAKIVYEKAKSFLYTVALRSMIDSIRHDKVKLQFVKQAPVNHTPDASQELQQKEFKNRLEAAISALPEAQREAFLMSRIDKMSYAEIADALGISVKAVEKRIHNALLNLKAAVEELKIFKV